MLMEGIVTRTTVTRNLPNKLGAPMDMVREGEVLRISNIDSSIAGTWYYVPASGWIKSNEMQITRDIGFLIKAKKMKLLDLQLFAPGTDGKMSFVSTQDNKIESLPISQRGIGGGIFGGTGVVGAGSVFGQAGSIGTGQSPINVGPLTTGGGCFGTGNGSGSRTGTNPNAVNQEDASVGGVLSAFGVNVGGGVLGAALNATSLTSLFDGSFFDNLLGNFMDSLFASFFSRMNFVLGFGDSDILGLLGSPYNSLTDGGYGYDGENYEGSTRKPELYIQEYTAADLKAREYFDYLGCANGKHRVETSRVRLMGIDDPAYWMQVEYPVQSFGGKGSGMDFTTPELETPVNFNNQIWGADYTDFDEAVEAVKKSLGFTIERQEWFVNFNRYRNTTPDYHLTGSSAHIFMTRPNLFLINNPTLGTCEDAAFFSDMATRHSVIYKSLTKEFSGSHHFIPIISNTAMSLDLQDDSLRTYEHGETLTKWKLKRAGNLIDSLTCGSFSISYVDDSQISISKLHLTWLNYMSGLNRGQIAPWDDYVRNAIIDYASSLYYILTDATGENIIFWTKYWGVFPTNFPESAFSLSKNDRVHTPEISIQYDYSFKKSMDPLILAEFNRNSSANGGNFEYVPIYNEETFRCNGATVGAPFISKIQENGTGKVLYKLRYRQAA